MRSPTLSLPPLPRCPTPSPSADAAPRCPTQLHPATLRLRKAAHPPIEATVAEAREAAREATLMLQDHHEEDLLKVLNHLNILNLPIGMPL
ncbi:MAG: hypothetical protein Q8P67_22260, partial [archaeon]|nr:hypothetical protein [archaeon]